MTPPVGSRSNSIAKVEQDGLGIACAGCHHPLTQEEEPHARKEGDLGLSLPLPRTVHATS